MNIDKITVMMRRNLYGKIATDLKSIIYAAGSLNDKDLDTQALCRVAEYADMASDSCEQILTEMSFQQ